MEDMVYVLSACRHLPSADEELASWLLDHREVSRRLLRALGDVRSAKASLGRLKELVDADEKSVLAYPELAVAFATAEPLKHYRDQPEPASLVDCFRYYTKARVRFRYDLRKMPYELSRHLANSRLNLKEREWAVSRYAKERNLGRAYFHLRYDYDHFRKGVPKKIHPDKERP